MFQIIEARAGQERIRFYYPDRAARIPQCIDPATGRQIRYTRISEVVCRVLARGETREMPKHLFIIEFLRPCAYIRNAREHSSADSTGAIFARNSLTPREERRVTFLPPIAECGDPRAILLSVTAAPAGAPRELA